VTRYEKVNLAGIVGLFGSLLAGLLSDKAFHVIFGGGFILLFVSAAVYTVIYKESQG